MMLFIPPVDFVNSLRRQRGGCDDEQEIRIVRIRVGYLFVDRRPIDSRFVFLALNIPVLGLQVSRQINGCELPFNISSTVTPGRSPNSVRQAQCNNKVVSKILELRWSEILYGHFGKYL